MKAVWFSLSLSLLLATPLASQLNCSTANSGTPCGPTMSGSFEPLGNHQRIVLQMANGFTDSVHGLIVIGLTNPNLPIPGTSCFLYTDWYVGHGFAWHNGNATVTHSWPNEIIGTLRFQAFTIRATNFGFELLGTNAVAATCLAP